jgi:hypothetical protein
MTDKVEKTYDRLMATASVAKSPEVAAATDCMARSMRVVVSLMAVVYRAVMAPTIEDRNLQVDRAIDGARALLRELEAARGEAFLRRGQ